MSEPQKPLSEVITSPEYWSEPVQRENAGLDFMQNWLFEALGVWAHFDKKWAQNIGRRVIDLGQNPFVAQIPEGAEIPMLGADTGQVVKVIVDSKMVNPKWATEVFELAEEMKDIKPEEIFMGSYFDLIVERIHETLVYTKEPAEKLIETAPGKITSYQRGVAYVAADRFGKAKVAVNGYNIKPDGVSDRTRLHILPPNIRQNQIFRDKVPGWPVFSKIVSAYILGDPQST